MNRFLKFCRERPVPTVLLALVSWIPWILFGLAAPNSDGIRWLNSAFNFWGLREVTSAYEMLFTEGFSLLVAPLVTIIPGAAFFYIGSLLFALSSALVTLLIWFLLANYIYSANSKVAFAIAFLFSCHPFLHQLHYYWMKELSFIGFFFAGLVLGAQYIVKRERKDLAWSGFFLGLSVLMRSQALVGFLAIFAAYFLFLVLEKKNPFTKKGLLDAALFVAVPLLALLPFRLMNFYRYDTFLLNKTLGWNVGVFMEMEGTYSPENGPASQRLAQMAAELDYGKGKNWTFLYDTPKSLSFKMSRFDWRGSDEFSVAIFKESVRANFPYYLKWGLRQSKGYLVGLSENPTEWQAAFTLQGLGEVRALPIDYALLNSNLKQPAYTAGLVDAFPGIVNFYQSFRTIYSTTITYLKKATTVLLPFILLLTFLRASPFTFAFLLTCALAQIGSAFALGYVVGFHHRFAVPYELFSLIYLGYVLIFLGHLLKEKNPYLWFMQTEKT